MKLIKRNEGFTCNNCGSEVKPVQHGASRNHCPKCLYSAHVDELPGDRLSSCGGLMKPIGVKKYRTTWKIVQQCEKCGKVQNNIAALDDNMEVIIALTSA